MEKSSIEKLIHFVGKATSPFHTIVQAKKELEAAGFEELAINTDWGLNAGGKYYTVQFGTCLIAFTIGKEFDFRQGFRIAAAHGDFPCFRIKPNPNMKEEKYLKINVEGYGGAILNTWLDRPLSVAGRVALRSDNAFKPKMCLIDIEKPILTIPNLAIHLNKEVNKGVELNKQTDMLPLAGMIEGEEADGFTEFLAEYLSVSPEDILDFELSVYNAEKPQLVGMKEEFLSSPRLDNITSVQAVLEALIDGTRTRGINVAAIFDHEEIGSRTKQGAGSMILTNIMQNIYFSLGRDFGKFHAELSDSMLLSVDVGHAYHPNQNSKNDPTNKGALNYGIAIKQAAGQSYATDSEGTAAIQQLCEINEIPYQKFVNRSDASSGSTLGSIASAMLPVMTVDIGIPLLAMHSARELMGVKDQSSLVQLVKAYYSY